jgi:hypothetical protein
MCRVIKVRKKKQSLIPELYHHPTKKEGRKEEN